MPAATAEFGRLPFSHQIAFFRRKLSLPTATWTDIYGAEHDRAFVVAGAANMDLLADLRDAVDEAVSSGLTLRDFRTRFDAIVTKHGWVYNGGRNWRSRVIYETNLRTSYQAGRYRQMQAVKRWRPYWRYVHQDGERHPRPWHQAWNGLVLHADDPWWENHYPPGGWGCKCTVDTLSGDDLARMGRNGPDTAPPDELQEITIGKRGPNPRTVTTPKGIDPGFGHIQGKTSLGSAAERYIEKSARLPPRVAAQAVLGLTSRRRILAGLVAEFGAWLAQVDRSRPQNDAFAVGAIEPKLLAALSQQGVEPETAAILVRDKEAAHALRDAKANRVTVLGEPKAVTSEQLAQLPLQLVDRRAVLLDRKSGSLLYVFDPPQRSAGKIVVYVNFRGKLATLGKSTFNAVQTVSLTETQNLVDAIDAGTLELIDGRL